MWHWADKVEARFARTSYWYSRPGSRATIKPITAKDLLLVETLRPAPVKGAIEGESLKPEATGGKIEIQEGFWELSGGKQIWWMDAASGDQLKVRFKVPEAGRYELFGHFGHARDYGIHTIRLLDRYGKQLLSPKQFDFFNDGIKWIKLSLGTGDLPEGEVILEITSNGKREAAVPRQMLGLDYLMLQRK
jgi:hypothetical protein